MAIGRPPGARGKNKDFLLNRLQKMYGDDFDPIMKIAKNCDVQQREADETISDVLDYYEKRKSESNVDVDKLRELKGDNTQFIIEMLKPVNEQWEKMAAYVHPKLKAVELQQDPNETLGGLDRESLILRLQYVERLALGVASGDGGDQGGAGEEGQVPG